MTRVALLLLLLLAPVSARGGGDPSDGHTHGAPAGAASGVAQGLVTTSALARRFEVVLKHAPTPGGQADRGLLYLADFATNAPVENATITLEEPGVAERPFTVRATGRPGVYAVERAAGFVRNGRFNVAVRIRAEGASDLLLLQNVYIGPVEAPSEGSTATKTDSGEGLPWIWILVVVGLGAGFFTWLVGLARKRKREAGFHTGSPLNVASPGSGADERYAASESASPFHPPHP